MDSLFTPLCAHRSLPAPNALAHYRVHAVSFEQCSLRVFPTVLELSKSLGGDVLEKATAAIAERGRFNVAISGGSVVEVCAHACVHVCLCACASVRCCVEQACTGSTLRCSAFPWGRFAASRRHKRVVPVAAPGDRAITP
jgi:hypothetical protein